MGEARELLHLNKIAAGPAIGLEGPAARVSPPVDVPARVFPCFGSEVAVLAGRLGTCHALPSPKIPRFKFATLILGSIRLTKVTKHVLT